MKPLAERHADRAQRKADQQAESDQTNDKGNIGHAANLIMQANDAIAALSLDEREELKAMISDNPDAFSMPAPDADANTMAGIGVVNPLTAPGGVYTELAQTGVQRDGKLPEPSFDPALGNANGQAVAKATDAAKAGGWGGGGGQGANVDPYGSLSVTELKAELDKRAVPYTASTAKQGLVDLLKADDSKS